MALKQTIRAPEGDDTDVHIRCTEKMVDGTIRPLDLTGKPIEFIAKESHRAPDSQAFCTYTNAVGGQIAVPAGAPADDMLVSIRGADVRRTGTFFFRASVFVDGRRKTVAYGDFILEGM